MMVSSTLAISCCLATAVLASAPNMNPWNMAQLHVNKDVYIKIPD